MLQIRAEAAYLYDAVQLYAKALIKVLDNDDNPRNGTAVINALKGSHYRSAMGWVKYSLSLKISLPKDFKITPARTYLNIPQGVSNIKLIIVGMK